MFERLVGHAPLQAGTTTPERLKEFAERFAEQLPSDIFTPAEVQNFLQDCRGDPMKALDELDAWARRNSAVEDSSISARNGAGPVSAGGAVMHMETNGTNGTNGGVIRPR